jgi:hypothetical protein
MSWQEREMGSGATNAATVNPTDEEIATVAYRLWLVRGCLPGSDQEDWFRAEAMLRNALAAKREDRDAPTASEMPAPWGGWQEHLEVWGHWEAWEREWGGARWVWDIRKSVVGVSNRARPAGKAA